MKTETKSFEQCCDEVAQSYGYTDFNNLFSIWVVKNKEQSSLQNVFKEAAQLWRKQGISDAIDLARQDFPACDKCPVGLTKEEIKQKLKV